MAFCLRISSRPRIHSRPLSTDGIWFQERVYRMGRGHSAIHPTDPTPCSPWNNRPNDGMFDRTYIHIYIFIFVSDPCVNGSFPHHLQSNRSMLHLPKILMWYLVHPIFVIFWALGMGCTTRIGFFSSKVILTYGCSRMAAALILLVPLVNLRSIVGEFCWGESYGHCSTHIFLVFGVLCLLTFILFFSDTDESFLVLR